MYYRNYMNQKDDYMNQKDNCKWNEKECKCKKDDWKWDKDDCKDDNKWEKECKCKKDDWKWDKDDCKDDNKWEKECKCKKDDWKWDKDDCKHDNKWEKECKCKKDDWKWDKDDCECDECKKCNHDMYEDSYMCHVHEFEESVKLAEKDCDRHNHRVAGVTGDAIPLKGGGHVHKIFTNTDNLDHKHQVCITTGPAIYIPGTKKHVHLVKGHTTFADGHCHNFLFTTQIEAPLV